MNLQTQIIEDQCQQLKLPSMAVNWPAIAQACSEKQQNYAELLQQLLKSEITDRQQRTWQTLLQLSGIPALKTLETFDYQYATGAPRAQIQELSHLAFIKR